VRFCVNALCWLPNNASALDEPAAGAFWLPAEKIESEDEARLEKVLLLFENMTRNRFESERRRRERESGKKSVTKQQNSLLFL
jgi:hypothetical protein